MHNSLAHSHSNRESGIEFLRLLCMLFVVFQHCLRYVVFPEVDSPSSSFFSSPIGFLIWGFSCVAVDCFVLISGYFSIKAKPKALLGLFFSCSFYLGLSYLLHIFLSDQSIGKSLVYVVVFPFTHSSLWFVNCYLILFLLSPLLNLAIEHMNQRQHMIMLLSLTFINVYAGSIWHTPFFDDNGGMNVLNFIYLYLIGRFISCYVKIQTIQRQRYCWLLIYILCSIIIGTIYRNHAYNSCLVIIGAIGLFLFFKSQTFHCKLINSLAVGAFSVYIAHENYYIRGHLYDYASKTLESFIQLTSQVPVLLIRTIFLVSFSIILMFFILLFDKVRQFFFKYILVMYDSFCSSVLYTRIVKHIQEKYSSSSCHS